jgi:hypothetical protein
MNISGIHALEMKFISMPKVEGCTKLNIIHNEGTESLQISSHRIEYRICREYMWDIAKNTWEARLRVHYNLDPADKDLRGLSRTDQ